MVAEVQAGVRGFDVVNESREIVIEHVRPPKIENSKVCMSEGRAAQPSPGINHDDFSGSHCERQAPITQARMVGRMCKLQLSFCRLNFAALADKPYCCPKNSL